MNDWLYNVIYGNGLWCLKMTYDGWILVGLFRDGWTIMDHRVVKSGCKRIMMGNNSIGDNDNQHVHEPTFRHIYGCSTIGLNAFLNIYGCSIKMHIYGYSRRVNHRVLMILTLSHHAVQGVSSVHALLGRNSQDFRLLTGLDLSVGGNTLFPLPLSNHD